MNRMTNSHILVKEFDYSEPPSIEETVSLLAGLGDNGHVIAGGTDLLVQMKMEHLAPTHLVSLGGIPELKEISASQSGLLIGAAASIRSISNDEHVRAWYPALAEACDSFSTTQIQVMGTIGGNLCNASPASDTAPALLVYSASLVITSPDGEREIPIEDFFVSPGESSLAPAELLTAIRLPRPEPGTGSTFMKVSRVTADIAKISVAAAMVRSGNEIVDCRIAFGSVAPTPIRVPQAEAHLTGQSFSEDLVSIAGDISAESISPIDDFRSSAWYRKEIAAVIARDALEKAWGNAENQVATPEFQEPQVPLQAERFSFTALSTNRVALDLFVNGRRHRVEVSPNDLLMTVLREQLHLTGTKYACGIGECSACTVLLDGQPVLACLVLAVEARDHEILTIEGLQAADGTLHPLQQAFIDEAGFQCGYCTPGVILTAKSLLAENPDPGEQDVRDYMRGNMCRCTGYASIVRSVMRGAGKKKVEAASG